MGVLEEIEKRIESKSINQDSLNMEISFIREELNKVLLEKEKYSEMASKLQMQLNDLKRLKRNAINLPDEALNLKSLVKDRKWKKSN